jgi:hypothetical protein
MEQRSTARFYFDTLGSAAEGLLTVLIDARRTDKVYRFGGLSADEILLSGMLIEGQIETISAKLEKIPGALRHEE